MLRSNDGELTYTLQPTATGLFVERVMQRHRKGRVMQAAEFQDMQGFRRWCDADAVRFQYPLVHQRLLRLAGQMLHSDESCEVSG